MDAEFFDKLMVVFCIIQSTTRNITGKTKQSRPIECMYVLALMYDNDIGIGDMYINLDCILSLLDLYLYRSDEHLSTFWHMKIYGYTFKYVHDSFKADKEIVLAAIKQYGLALEYAHKSLKAEPLFMLQIKR